MYPDGCTRKAGFRIFELLYRGSGSTLDFYNMESVFLGLNFLHSRLQLPRVHQIGNHHLGDLIYFSVFTSREVGRPVLMILLWGVRGA